MKNKLLIWIFFAVSMLSNAWAETSWKSLAPGLEYSRLMNFPAEPNGMIHAFKVDPARFTLQSKIIGEGENTSIADILTKSGAVIAVNGGYFSPEIKPMGLRMSQGQVLNKPRSISWWGIFYLNNSRPNIVSPRDFQPNKSTSFAIQAGPRLVIDGEIPKLAAGVADRSALGITREGKIIVLATENLNLSTKDLAEIMRASEKDDGLNCVKALNLDGGHSTQLYTRMNNFNLQRYNVSQVADLVLVLPK